MSEAERVASELTVVVEKLELTLYGQKLLTGAAALLRQQEKEIAELKGRLEEWQNEDNLYLEEERARDQRLDCVAMPPDARERIAVLEDWIRRFCEHDRKYCQHCAANCRDGEAHTEWCIMSVARVPVLEALKGEGR